MAEIKTAIEQLSFEQRAELAAWLHGWKDDEWDEQMKRDVADRKLDDVLREVEDDIRARRLRDMRGLQLAFRPPGVPAPREPEVTEATKII